MAPEDQWHLDKRIPLALVAAIFLQTVGMVWWAATMQADVRLVIAVNDRQDGRIDGLADVVQGQLVQNARTESELIAIRQILVRQELLLDRLNQTLAERRQAP